VVSTWDADASDYSDKVRSALAGTRINADVQVRQSGDYTNIDLRKIKRAAAAPAAAAAAPAAPAAENKPF